MNFESAMLNLRAGYAMRRTNWKNNLLWSPGSPNIRLFYPSGFSEVWRPTLDDVQALDWERFP